MSPHRLRVATVITRMTAGAGGVALRGALALDPTRYDVTIIAGGAGFAGENPYDGGPAVRSGPDAVRGAPPGDLLAAAEAAGLRGHARRQPGRADLAAQGRRCRAHIDRTARQRPLRRRAYPQRKGGRARPDCGLPRGRGPRSCTPITASRSTISRPPGGGVPMWRSSGGSAGAPTRCSQWVRRLPRTRPGSGWCRPNASTPSPRRSTRSASCPTARRAESRGAGWAWRPGFAWSARSAGSTTRRRRSSGSTHSPRSRPTTYGACGSATDRCGTSCSPAFAAVD